jgi:hypothetical protein
VVAKRVSVVPLLADTGPERLRDDHGVHVAALHKAEDIGVGCERKRKGERKRKDECCGYMPPSLSLNTRMCTPMLSTLTSLCEHADVLPLPDERVLVCCDHKHTAPSQGTHQLRVDV